MKKYLTLWLLTTGRATQVALASRLGAVLFTLGKILRFLFFLIFLILLTTKTKSLAGYSLWQVIFVFLTFNLVDILAQFFLREVYRFRSQIISGSFDYILTKPMSPLFRSLFGGADILDIFTLVPLLFFIVYVADKTGTTPTGAVLYTLLVVNAFVIAVAFHIMVLALGVIATEVDNAIWIFRDITQLGRVPVDIYREPVSWILTFIIPVAAMITIPSQAVFGILSIQGIVIAISFGIGLLLLSHLFWKYSLRHYGSASS